MSTAPPAAQASLGVRYVVLFGLCLAAVIFYVHRNSIGVAEEDIRQELGITKDEMGWVMGAFFATYALFQIPAGWAGDRWGSRRTLPALLGIGSFLSGLMGLASGFSGLVAARLATGAAQAGIFPSSTNTISQWFPATRRAFANACLGSSQSVGSAVGTFLTGRLLPHLSWRWVFPLYALPGVVWAVWFYVWFRDRPEEHPKVSSEELTLVRGSAAPEPSAREDRPPTPWRAIATSVPMMLISAQQFFRAAGYMFFASWFATFLKETRGVSTEEAGTLNSLPFVAIVLGGLLGGYVSDAIHARTGNRRWSRQAVAVLSLAVSAVLMALAYPVHDAHVAVLVISAGSFFAGFGGPSAYTITIDMGGQHVATVFSTMNMWGNVGAILFPIVVPWLVEQTENWNAVLFLLAGIQMSAALCWLCLNPEGTIFDRTETSPVA